MCLCLVNTGHWDNVPHTLTLIRSMLAPCLGSMEISTLACGGGGGLAGVTLIWLDSSAPHTLVRRGEMRGATNITDNT